ncbi:MULTISPECIES: GNAT family N-acetyltransferase [unclassified Sphingopyxis]|uniref:GNAT family N-acetyltransferase n=1 Tax=unclassified Sphingopyxis TaxID=2614943 RepID=UPI00286040B7|nr:MULTISPECIES: GNAT family N-acetyltransferase [unclassified Sphingopyxis]MDR6832487.1 ribosomal-protein-alanine N-acetyltransferase [Sphingopyxis sp. BE122]MDR7228230.1 ribosomal-protein-alanine N-acetyltransferase [Sphingopyxis sp. BE259]
MMGDIRLATARVGDLAAVMRVMDAAFAPTYGEAWSGAQLLTLFALPSARVCIAWDGDQPCGFSASRIAGPESELLLLAVDPAWRGRGIGRALIQDWQLWANAQGADEYFLEMRADNDAIHLYARVGFSEVGRRSAYYRGNDGVMRDAITMRQSRIATGAD